MADNVEFTREYATPKPGILVGADEIGGVKFQRMKVTLGADGVNDGDVSGTNPMPTYLYDSAGNVIGSHLGGDGDYHIGVDATLSGNQNPSRNAWITTTQCLSVAENTRLVGTNFDGTTQDPNFWTETLGVDGTVTQNGGVVLATGAGANGTAKYASVRSARFVVGYENRFLCACRFTTAGVANNVRRIGAYDTNEGFFFQLDGTTFSIGSRTGASDTLVSSGSFNGNCGATYVMDTAYHKLEIEIMPVAAFFYIDGCLIHTLPGSLTAKLSFPITMENINDAALASNIELEVVGSVITRQGKLLTNPISYYHASGQTAGANLKIGNGSIHGVVISNCADNAVITLSDSITDTSDPLWVYTSGKLFELPVSLDMYGLPFLTGLRLTISAANAGLTVIYE